MLTKTSTPVRLPTNIAQIKQFFTSQPVPDDLHVTVLSTLQQLAAKELAGRDGAVVALDPRTGAVLAMYSNPSYDPSPLASHDQAPFRRPGAIFSRLQGLPCWPPRTGNVSSRARPSRS